MEDDREGLRYGTNEAGISPVPPLPSPNLVTLSAFTPVSSPYSRRLSSHFPNPKPNLPVQPHAVRQLAWVSLQGRLIGAEEASSARTIGGGLSPQQAVAWELFSPIHRILIVAVVAVAVANSKRDRQIHQLRKCVELRDEILLSMQQKLDNLCEQVNNVKDEPETISDMSRSHMLEFLLREASEPGKLDFVCTDCWLCDQHRAQSNDLLGNSTVKVASGDEMFKYKAPLSNGTEQEERRMSDLSDWASSVTSTVDLQLNNLAIEQDVYNLKRECEEKDVAIKELSTFIRSKDAATSKRIEELEDIIRRKNMIITKLRKDMAVLEQKVVQLARVKRSSCSGLRSENKELPMLRDNLLFDMDCTTSPSSSDSDSSSGKRKKTSTITNEESFTSVDTSVHSKLTSEPSTHGNCKSVTSKVPTSLVRRSEQHPTSHTPTPLMEKSMNLKSDRGASSRLKQLSASRDIKKGRKRAQEGLKDAAPQRRWVGMPGKRGILL